MIQYVTSTIHYVASTIHYVLGTIRYIASTIQDVIVWGNESSENIFVGFGTSLVRFDT